MEKLVKPARVFFLAVLIAALAAVYSVTLYRLQIVEGERYYEASRNNIITTQTVTAARGSIMDRYGRTLVTNRACNNLVINVNELFYTDGIDSNEAILRLCRTVLDFGDSYVDELPITMSAPFEYTEMSNIQRARLNAWMDANGVSREASAVEVMAAMRSRYSIDNSYTGEETRMIAGVRYEVNVRYLINTSPYIFAEDVSMALITTLMENDVPGFDVQTSYVREYNTSHAAQILGYIRMMDENDVNKYRALGYKLDAQVGKDGAEYAFESYLHGIDGEARITSTAEGVVTDTVYTEEPEPGSHIYLTIDIGLQEAAENALNSYILPTNAERQKANEELEKYGGDPDDYTQLITGGAVVAVDVKTGEPLAIASWPSYDPAAITDDYASLLEMPNDPLFNRALMGAYAPGSTFKPCAAIGALDKGIISTGSTVECVGVYDRYKDAGYAPACWISPGKHGPLNVVEAIAKSCNYFFYYVGDYLTVDNMRVYAEKFGLGEPTGIELPENIGHMSTPEYKAEAYAGTGQDTVWRKGDDLQTAIGQLLSEFSPMQIAEYCAAVANGGERHSASILKSVRSYDFSESLYERESEVLSSVETDEEYFEAVQLGMRNGAGENGASRTIYDTFLGADYNIAAKTGTAQRGEGQTNNAVFMCYAPYEKPEIALAVVVEKGASGALNAEIARNVLDYYFSFRDSAASLESESTLLK